VPLRFLPPDPRPPTTDERLAAIYNDVAHYPDMTSGARAAGITVGTFKNRIAEIRKAGQIPLIDRYSMRGRTRPSERAPDPVRRYLLTAAQDDTDVHRPFWENLLAYAEEIGAEVMVGPFTYNKAVFSDHETRNGAFRAELQPYLRYDQVDLGPIVFCAEMNTLPTATHPLSSLEPYTGQKWGVFPHAKIQLVSVPTVVGRPAKQIMTTGCCTIENYIEKKAGLKARFHHCIGATLVEIDAAGRLWCRQINASSDGSFYDLDIRVEAGSVTYGHRVEAITWGDIHREKLDPDVADSAWGFDIETDRCQPRPDTMIDALRPRYQFFHDLFDGEPRNSHRIKDHRFRFQMLLNGTDLVEDAVALASNFLWATERDFCQSVVVFSNHDDQLSRWLDTADFREDPANAEYFLRLQLVRYEAMRRGEKVNIFRHALAEKHPRRLAGVTFVDDDQSFVICQASGGIECGMHGHLGLNGARGNAVQFTKTAMKINKGHDHSPSIHAGVYTAGLSGLMDQGYNRGLSGWAHTHVITYETGKRSLVTITDGKWRA
jgi:hypothetical protein